MTANRPLLPLALVLLLLLAGCAQKADDAPTATEAPTQTEGKVSYVAATLGPEPVEAPAAAAKETVMLLKARAGPAANLTSFLYTIPEGAIVEESFSPGSSFTIRHLDFVFVPAGGNVSGLEEYAVLVFRLGKDADLRGAYVDTTMVGTQRLGPVATETEHKPGLDAFYVYIGASDLEPGDRLAIVVAARAAAEQPFSYLVKVAQRSVFHYEGPPSSAPEDLLGGRPAFLLPPLAEGAGFQYASYYNYNGLGSGYEMATAAAKVEDALPRTDPLVTARDVTLSAASEAAGFTMASGFYLGTNAHGLWSVDAQAHGTKVAGQSVVAQDLMTPAFTAEVLLFGLPSFVLQGDGEGGSSTVMHLQVTDVNTLVDFLIFDQLDLGMALQDLVGQPGASGGNVFTGLAGNVPPTMAALHDGRALLMDGEGRLMSRPLEVPRDG